jgi:hypothetical protein
LTSTAVKGAYQVPALAQPMDNRSHVVTVVAMAANFQRRDYLPVLRGVRRRPHFGGAVGAGARAR